MASVIRCGEALEFASARLRKKPAIVRQAIQSNHRSIRYAHESFKRCKALALEVIQRCPQAIVYFDALLQHDHDIRKCFVKAKQRKEIM
jgi:hypothetical protein